MRSLDIQTDRQAREHLAQAQRKKRRINKTRTTTGVDFEPFFLLW
jgi:hypothetical protein